LKGNFKDAWREANSDLSDEDGWTFTTLKPKPKKRIDFVLYRTLGDSKRNVTGEYLNMNLLDCQVIENDEYMQVPSDHRGLVAKFSLEKISNKV
jgi:hypothetical protein